MNVLMYANTNGRGYWSDRKAEVKIDEIKIGRYTQIDFDSKHNMIYIDAKFDSATWRVFRDGLIYTDNRFIKEFRLGLQELGMSRRLANKVDYTEQGMQGKNYVSLGLLCRRKSDVEAVFKFFGKKMTKRFLISEE